MARKQFKKTTKGRGKSFDERKDKGNRNTDFFKDTADNDPRWYASTPQLLADTASFPFGQALGSRLDFGTYGDALNDSSIPGIMTIDFVPIFGTARTNADPLNVAAKSTHTRVNHMNSRNLGYDPSDLMLMYMALDQANLYLSWMKRIYGVCNLVNVYNRYTPQALLRSMGVKIRLNAGSSSSVLQNIADFRAYINTYAMKLSALCVPAHMPIFRRHEWMCENIFLDAPGNKSQMYLYNPTHIGIFKLDEEKKGMLEYVPIRDDSQESEGLTFYQIMSFGDRILNAILYGAGQQDFNIISADILKAYGESGIHRASLIDGSYSVYPVYSPEVLTQIQNAVCLPVSVVEEKTLNWAYTQDMQQNCLRSTNFNVLKEGRMLLNPYDKDTLITLPMDTPSPADVVVATRLTNKVSATYNPQVQATSITITKPGSEICLGYRITRINYTGDDWNVDVGERLRNIVDIPCENEQLYIEDLGWYINNYGAIASFDWHPLMYVCAHDTAEVERVNFQANVFLGDIQNYTILDSRDLESMNEMALLSLLGMEQFGAVSNFDRL